MKKQINEIKRMQFLAGIIKEDDGMAQADNKPTQMDFERDVISMGETLVDFMKHYKLTNIEDLKSYLDGLRQAVEGGDEEILWTDISRQDYDILKKLGYTDLVDPGASKGIEESHSAETGMKEDYDYTRRSDDTEGEDYSNEIKSELEDRFERDEIDQETLQDALDFVDDNGYELYSNNLKADYVIEQLGEQFIINVFEILNDEMRSGNLSAKALDKIDGYLEEYGKELFRHKIETKQSTEDIANELMTRFTTAKP